jgi:hypothetical protein
VHAETHVIILSRVSYNRMGPIPRSFLMGSQKKTILFCPFSLYFQFFFLGVYFDGMALN